MRLTTLAALVLTCGIGDVAFANPIAIGSSGIWYAEGELSNSSGQVTWDNNGLTSQDHTYTADSIFGGSQVTISNFINTDTHALKLQSGTNARFALNDWERAHAFSSTTATMNDLIFTTSTLDIPLDSLLVFTWAIDGTLLSDLHSSVDLSPRNRNGDVLNRMFLGYYASYEFSTQWIVPGTGAVQDQVLAEHSIVRTKDDHTLSDEITDFDTRMTIVEDARYPDFAPGTKSYKDERNIDKSGGSSAELTVPAGVPVQIMFSLLTGYSMAAGQTDFGDLDFQLASEFQNTAQLTSVRLVNGDGTPFVGEWTLNSANGYTYPIQALAPGMPGAPVPEPGTLTLLMVAAGVMVARARRATGALPARRRQRSTRSFR